MKHISGDYIKDRQLIPFECDIASGWDELTPRQMASVLDVLNNRDCSKSLRAVSLLCLLFGDKNFAVLAGLNDELLYALAPVTNFLLETRPKAKNPFPKLPVGRNIFLAPADSMSNIGFGEWCFAYQVYHGYYITRDDQWLDKLIAVLYRPKDPRQDPGSANFKGDIRQPFNENLIDQREKLFKRLQPGIKQAVFTWFSAALLDVMEARRHVFPLKNDANEPEPANENRTWFTVFREILGPKWGTTEQLKQTNAFFVLDALEEQQIELKSLRGPH